ncbi:response regulator transcription factor [Mangrovivirga cuniculi]|uniref:response regulator transcription factor n=1 Tax=Mangrovivirga cuniculi TaxID=2715131 RepID=UPI0026AD5030|nr:response regulator [Mangrovivirga cuniculi]
MKKKILIVDDEPNILMSLDFLMRRNGYDVFVARDGNEALSIFQDEKPDLIILDIMMPNIGGYEVCRAVKSSDKKTNTQVLILTAKDKEEDIKRGYEAGADHYMTKPFSTKNLVAKVKELIN